ncbi:hypothetical protein FOCC_FOCC002155 [Frankliniella occidentalis]|nr:hypothetical protein FOCC_FOCC002155 [Frankliniella occidentalis]
MFSRVTPPAEACATDSDEEPAHKQPRLCSDEDGQRQDDGARLRAQRRGQRTGQRHNMVGAVKVTCRDTYIRRGGEGRPRQGAGRGESIDSGTAATSGPYLGFTERKECLARGWGSLQGRADKLLRRDMDALRDELLRVRGAALGAELGDMDQLDERISAAKREIQELQLTRPDMLQQQLQELQQTRASWTQFEQHLQELRLALRQDQEALQQVDRALQSGAVSPAVASSVREVARALSEKHEGPAASSATSSVPGEQS